MTGPPIKTQGSNPRLAELDSPSVVRSYLPSNCEVIEVQNDPSRWEAASWPHLWSHILHDSDAEDAVLYCHAKGVTRPAIIAHEFGGTAQNWANLLYTLNLDYWPLVEAQLRRHPIVGAFRKGGHFFQAAGLTSAGMAASAWHYSGNFWWVRAGDFRHRWPKVAMPADRWGAEAWVGIAYAESEAGQIGPLQNHSGINLYNFDFWNKEVVPAYSDWLRSNRPARISDLNASYYNPVGIPRLSIFFWSKGRGSLDRTLSSITHQLLPGDELIVEHDDTGDWGATPRTRGMRQATGTYLLWMDDDDVYHPSGLARVRNAIVANPGRPLMFQMRRASHLQDVLWSGKDLVQGNVSTQMFVVPNDKSKLGVWGCEYTGDYEFIKSTLSYYHSESLVWIPEIIAIWRPD